MSECICWVEGSDIVTNPECKVHSPPKVKSKTRGFAGMSKEKRQEIASKGGKTSHKMGRAHQFTSEEARAAGHKGGVSVSKNKDHMSKIGKIGGKARGFGKIGQEARGIKIGVDIGKPGGDKTVRTVFEGNELKEIFVDDPIPSSLDKGLNTTKEE